MSKRPQPSQLTHVMRRMGQTFDPETVCEYTGLPLHKFPVEVGDGQPELMGYWRTDGALVAARLATQQEKDWVRSNQSAYLQQLSQFQAWLGKTRKNINQ